MLNSYAISLVRMLGIYCALLLLGQAAHAQVLTPDLETKLLPGVGASWVSVPLENTYTSPVVICSYNLPSSSDPTATTRVRSVTSTSFQVRIQQFENSSTVTASSVHCIIADEGAYNSGGLKFEARTVLSDRTSGLSVPGGWGLINNEEVTGSLTQSYAAPVILGQVMSFNDVNASVFWTYNCVTRGNPPFIAAARMCVGKHIGQINSSRASETIGYIIAETGSGTVNDMVFELARGANSVAGVGNTPPYTYSIGNDYDIGIVSQNAENGGQGGWAVLYGVDPLLPNQITLAIDEEVVAGDTGRGHINEEVSYWVFRDNQTTNLDASKSVAMSSESASPYAIPGSDVLYTISSANTGSKSVDLDTVLIIDSLPPDAAFYNGDVDGPGPESGAIIFTSTGSGLSFNEAADLAFSNAAVKPTSFAACTYTPGAGYDPAVTYICLSPKGSFNAGSLSPSSFSLQFRVQVK